MSGAFRLPHGGRVDRRKPVTIHFNGVSYAGFAGDTLASLLLAHGQHFVGRSFKYHRPRGFLGAGSEEPNALFALDRGMGRVDPNNRGTVAEARDGLAATSQNHFPSLGFDIGAVNDLLAPLFPAGFYYKTFKWPPSFWTKLYEPVIRRAAGLGEAPSLPDPDRYANRHAHCEVLIIGAGPAGIAAALAAAESGKRVILADEQAEMGGALLHDLTSEIDGMPAAEWLDAALRTLRERKNVTLLPRTTGFGYYNHNHLALVERVTDHLAEPPPHLPRERLWQVRAKEVVLTTGAHERPLVFADNDRPGILLAEALRAFVNRYAVKPGQRVVVATSGGSAYRVAADLDAAGIAVTLVDLRQKSAIGEEQALITGRPIRHLPGHTILGAKGRSRVSGLVVAPLGAEGRIGKPETLPCDCVGMSGGWTPAVHLFSQSRGALWFDSAIDAFVPDRHVQAERSAGAAKGSNTLAACLAEGFAAGAEAASIPRTRHFSASGEATAFTPVRHCPTDADPARLKAFVDFQNDVTAKDIGLAVREGFHSVEHVKRYTTTGMASDQGKTSNMNALGLIGTALERTPPEIGTTTFRPPYTPVSFGALVGPSRGALFDPTRVTPIHEEHVETGARFEDVGLWKRAWYYPQNGEGMRAAVDRECRAVRTKAGLFDASTLGKIEVEGPDAAEFLDRLYINALASLAPGRCRYALMLKEDGHIFDDGIVARLTETRFHVTTTTGGAARVFAHMEDYRQTEWPDLRVHIASVTEQFAVIALQGPRAEAILAPLVDCDLAPEAFPFMSCRETRVGGIPARLFRVSFTGEPGFEINVPAEHGRALWTRLAAHPEVTPYGTEAMHVLRAEAGFIIVGQESDGTVTPDDLGLSGMIGKTKGDFVGKRGLARPDLVAEGRKQLVGLATEDPALVLEEGAQIVAAPDQPIPMAMFGHVTSSYFSANAGRSIAMALLKNGRARHGETLFVTTARGFTPARVVPPRFPLVGAAPTEEASPKAGAAMGPSPRRPAAVSPDMPAGAFRLLPSRARFVLRLAPEIAAGLSDVGGFDLSMPLGRMRGETRKALRLGPDEFLLQAPAGEEELVRQALSTALAGHFHALFEVSHRQVGIAVSGPDAAAILNAGCPLDLAPEAFPPGSATRTLFGKAEIVLMRPMGEAGFQIEVARSFSDYFLRLLSEAALDFGEGSR